MTRIERPIDIARLGDEWLEADGFGGFTSGTVGLARTRYPLSMQRYAPDLTYPDITANLLSFDTNPWPTWCIALGDTSTSVVVETFVAKASGECVLRWRLDGAAASGFMLKVRPLLSGRDCHALHHWNEAFNFNATETGADRVAWQPYGDVPVIHAATNGEYTHAPDWYRNFCYERERERGLDFTEDLATPACSASI